MKGNDLKERLARYRQIKTSVIGRKSGKTISIPVWFVLEAENLYLLPVQGSETQWYKNVLRARRLASMHEAWKRNSGQCQLPEPTL
jgi:hypothetical protein